MTITFYHNPRCSKSRAVHDLLKNSGKPFEVVEYLQKPFSRDSLLSITQRLNTPVDQLIRTSDKLFKELSINPETLNEHTVIELLIDHPSLFQRPVVVSQKAARIGRPPEAVLEII